MKTRVPDEGTFTAALGEDANSILNTFPHPISI